MNDTEPPLIYIDLPIDGAEITAETTDVAGRVSDRLTGYAGLTVLNNRGDRHFNGVVRTVPEALDKPLRWRKPRMVLVNNMSDLFHEAVPFEFIDRVFAVMALTPQHTYQVLTKRPERMAEYFSLREFVEIIADMRAMASCSDTLAGDVARAYANDTLATNGNTRMGPFKPPRLPWKWPLPNVWLGTSIEDQAAAEKRIPHLLRCPAAVRFLSCEPLLELLDLEDYLGSHEDPKFWAAKERGESGWCKIHWVIAGGESGTDARPCDPVHLDWLRDRCLLHGTPFFLKQIGARPVIDHSDSEDWLVEWAKSKPHTLVSIADGKPCEEYDSDGMWADAMVHVRLRDRKGGNPQEWPEDLRVREMPGEKALGIGQ